MSESAKCPSPDSDDEDKTAAATTTTTTATTKAARGPRYNQNEDLIICQAFIIASENPIVGVSQKSKTFVETMFKIYTDKCYRVILFPSLLQFKIQIVYMLAS
jgi:hypothetical protein